MLDASRLHVFAARSNPLNWQAPHRNWLRFARHMLDSGVNLTVVECAFGEEDFTCQMEGVNHIGVRAVTRGWTKENLLNIGIHRVPEAQYIAWIDADVIFRRPDWAEATVRALQHYDVVQPWRDAYDLGPHGDHIAHHRSFCHQHFHRKPVVPNGPKFWHSDGGPHQYPHSGYAWAMTRTAYDRVGGLFEYGGMGSGDHHMALGLVGHAAKSMPHDVHDAYRAEVMRWAERAERPINGNIGFVPGTIEHLFHGRKSDRGYQSRWEMFRKGFHPHEDLKRNAYGVFEFAQNKPELRHAFDLYLHSRNEDLNSAW